VQGAYEPLVDEESDKLLDQDAIVQEAIRQVENNGIVFLDEIDKIAAARTAPGRTCPARACSATCCP
jgi:ATP-dependent HslUV protease ATP-binding subunit HslU